MSDRFLQTNHAQMLYQEYRRKLESKQSFQEFSSSDIISNLDKWNGYEIKKEEGDRVELDADKEVVKEVAIQVDDTKIETDVGDQVVEDQNNCTLEVVDTNISELHNSKMDVCYKEALQVATVGRFMRLEPDRHLKVYDWGGGEWKTVVDLLTSGNGDCGYPMVCGKYGICSSNGQCSCFAETGIFKQINYKQTNLGCSLVTPISYNHSQYHSLLELENISYFNLNSGYNNKLDKKIPLEDCKNACLRNCSCKAALFADTSSVYPTLGGCLLLSQVFSLINDEVGSNNPHIFLKVQNSPTKQSSPPIDFPRKKSRRGTIILGSSLGALFGACLLVGSCIFVFKMKREPEELDE
ncbi:hypothetical protein RHGRI_017382 [Rhododendron griersonianum]|uniref:Apple domain-containing protein n=1 Tax=Rhododendron griersonianum TaxID=479676 RepID=A0AAV6JXP4_9ERIC|nr:hypothetical protein RHGRI_017382 [Rhododendron griersonianum]